MEWCTKNYNVKKNKAMIFGTRSKIKKARGLKVVALGKEIKQVPSHKYLGFNLDQTLNFRMHVNTVIQVVSRKMYVFGKLHKFMLDKSASDVYKSMILPYFDYCDIIYSQTAAECEDKLQRLQNRGIRIYLRSDPRGNVAALHRSIKIPYLADRRELHLIVHMSSKRNCNDLINNRHPSNSHIIL